VRSPHIGRGSNSANLRLYHERLLLQALRRSQPTAKADLARQANLTSTAVGSIIASLDEAGLIEHIGRRLEGQRGQPASLIRLNPRGAFGIGVRIDRTSIETVLVNFSGDVLSRSTLDKVLPHPDEVLKILQRDIQNMLVLLTPGERQRPEIISGSRRLRVARGSGTTVQDVNRLLKQYLAMKKMMRSFSKGFGARRFGKMVKGLPPEFLQ